VSGTKLVNSSFSFFLLSILTAYGGARDSVTDIFFSRIYFDPSFFFMLDLPLRSSGTDALGSTPPFYWDSFAFVMSVILLRFLFPIAFPRFGNHFSLFSFPVSSVRLLFFFFFFWLYERGLDPGFTLKFPPPNIG